MLVDHKGKIFISDEYEEIRLLLFKIMCLAKDGLVKDKAKTIQTIF